MCERQKRYRETESERHVTYRTIKNEINYKRRMEEQRQRLSIV